MSCVETSKTGRQCEHKTPHSSDHFNSYGERWPAKNSTCDHDNDCQRDLNHEDECRPRGWIAPTLDHETFLWVGAIVSVLVAIGQLAAERERQKLNGHRFQWLEVD